jgi:hypothetical protein
VPNGRQYSVAGFGAVFAATEAAASKPANVATMMRISASIEPPGGNMHIDHLYNLNGRVNRPRPYDADNPTGYANGR